MNKVFEALKRIRQETAPATYMPDFNKGECCDVIEQALMELKAIKEAEPSEAMKCLESLRKNANTFCQHMPEQCELNKKYADTIKNYILKAQELEGKIEILKEYRKDYLNRLDNLEKYSLKQDKVLEIIKDLLGKHCKIELINGGTYYQIKIKIMGSDYSFGMSITKEEFDTLNKNLPKEMCEKI